MNRRRAGRAAAAGAAGALMVSAALYLSLAVVVLEAYPLGGGSSIAWIALILLLFLVAVIGSAIFGRVLGAGWLRSFGSALSAHAAASALAFGLLPLIEPFDGWGSYLAVEFAVAITVTVLLCAAGLRGTGKLLVIGIGAVLLLASLPFESLGPGLIPALAGIVCWTLLPAVAGLFID